MADDKVQSYYSRPEVQDALLEVSKDREIVSVFKEGRFGSRPNMLQYPADIEQAVREGTLSFHGSVERWKHPMKLESGMAKDELDRLRSGWDIIIDLDVPDFDVAKVAAGHMIKALKDHGLSSMSVKFTGGKSFHIGVPFESMPKRINTVPTESLYPEASKKILEYLKWYTTEPLREALIDMDTPVGLADRVNKSLPDVVGADGIEPFKIVDVDIFGSRHMFRLPYSLHEKSLLASVPIRIENLKTFSKDRSEPEKVKVDQRFLYRELGREDAHALVLEAFDWASKYMREEEPIAEKVRSKPKRIMKIHESEFPPCVLSILKGLADGRKRSIFVLINFLNNMGWSHDEIERRMFEWNEKNYPPVRSNYIRSQLRWHTSQERNMLPPNCDNRNFYCSFGVCSPDSICCKGSRVSGDAKVEPCSPMITMKNPVNYPFRKMKQEGRFRPRKDEKRK